MSVSVALGGIAPWSIIGLMVVLFIRGDVVPRKHLKDLLGRCDAAVAQAEKARDAEHADVVVWRDAYLAADAARAKAEQQVDELMVLARTTTHVLTQLPTPDPGTGGENAPAVAS